MFFRHSPSVLTNARMDHYSFDDRHIADSAFNTEDREWGFLFMAASRSHTWHTRFTWMVIDLSFWVLKSRSMNDTTTKNIFIVEYLVVGNRMCLSCRYTLVMCQRCNPKSTHMLHRKLSSKYCDCSSWNRVHNYTDCLRIADSQMLHNLNSPHTVRRTNWR